MPTTSGLWCPTAHALAPPRVATLHKETGHPASSIDVRCVGMEATGGAIRVRPRPPPPLQLQPPRMGGLRDRRGAATSGPPDEPRAAATHPAPPAATWTSGTVPPPHERHGAPEEGARQLCWECACACADAWHCVGHTSDERYNSLRADSPGHRLHADADDGLRTRARTVRLHRRPVCGPSAMDGLGSERRAHDAHPRPACTRTPGRGKDNGARRWLRETRKEEGRPRT
ncbi:hypothetical protein B0H17DRAFT_1202808 [Mycena rosella]|uniref:Uncharacterized protein n=1 Tax=Mycena rosella TaxID=1033263 RepID=A0AAD7DCZ8_MYCRO|nr:hypothetical protein B0H17DRAFT_1202808 [Mycena rosella]